MIFTEPGAEITSVVRFTFISVGLTTVAAIGVVFTMICEVETNSLPFTIIVKPCWTCENETELGESDPITGAGRALEHNGFRVLLQPRRNVKPNTSRHTKGRPQLRKRMGDTPLEWITRLVVASGTSKSGAELVVERCAGGGPLEPRPLNRR